MKSESDVGKNRYDAIQENTGSKDTGMAEVSTLWSADKFVLFIGITHVKSSHLNKTRNLSKI